MRIKNLSKLIIAVVVCELVGVVGSFFTIPAISSWYLGLVKPRLSPPNWIFAPVWTTLFLLMGIALFLIWARPFAGPKERKRALAIFGIQLALNVLWSIIFFGWHNPAAAFFDIVALWLAILASVISFGKIFRPAAYLLLPYIFWVSFAVYLNFAIWRLN